MIVIYAKHSHTKLVKHVRQTRENYDFYHFQYIPGDPLDYWIQNYKDHLTACVWYVPGTIDLTLGEQNEL